MIVHGYNVEIMQFESLKELLKIMTSHFILKYDIDNEERAIYYAIVSSVNSETVCFCFDVNIKEDFLQYSDITGKFTPIDKPKGTCIAITRVEYDTLLEGILEEYFKEEEK